MDEPRVLLVTKGLDLGGLERIVTDLAVGLGKRGWTVAVAVVNPRRDQLVPTLDRAGVVVHRLAGTDRIGFKAGRRLTKLVRSGSYDVVHVHGPLPASLVRLVAGNVPVVTTSHTPWPSLNPFTRALWRMTLRRDATTVAVSSGAAATLPRPARDRAVVIPHGVDPARIAAALATPDVVSGDRPMAVIVVASHRDAKNYPNLLRGVKVARDHGALLAVTCVGEGDGLPAHRSLASSLGLDDVVTFEPPTEHVLERIATADVLVVASDYEGQPFVVAEALALGKPVIATAVGRVPEMVSPSVGIIVPPRDPQALGEALAMLANHPRRRSVMTGHARRLPVSWTLDDVIDAHQALYRRVSGR